MTRPLPSGTSPRGADCTRSPSLGGLIVRGKLWYSISASETVEPHSEVTSTVIGNSRYTDAYVAKLNAQPGAKHSVAASYVSTPQKDDCTLDIIADRYGPTRREFEGARARLDEDPNLTGQARERMVAIDMMESYLVEADIPRRLRLVRSHESDRSPDTRDATCRRELALRWRKPQSGRDPMLHCSP